MVKIFIGNLSQHAGKDEVEALFTQYGTVTECAKYKNYAFIHMDDRKCATKAIRELHLFKLNGRPINVELSRAKNQGPVKLHVANVEKGFDQELRILFEEYGVVTECAIIKDFGFVHMANSEEAMDAIKGLDNTDFQGKRIHVQISKSRPRGVPEEEAYPPPPASRGYYPPRYPAMAPEPPYRAPEPPYRPRMAAYPTLPPPPPLPPPPRRAPYPDPGYRMVDYYEKYRANPYAADDRRAIPPPPPPPSALGRDRGMVSADPYNHRPTQHAPPPYMARDRSPIRRTPLPPPLSAGNGYPYERAGLSPMYEAPRPRDSYSERAPPPPPPPRYAGY